MLKEEFVSFEQAKALKELRFPQNSLETETTIYFDDGSLVYLCDSAEYEDTHNVKEAYRCSTLSLVQKWMREEKNYWIEITTKAYATTHFVECSVVDNETQMNYNLYWTSYGGTNVCFETYEQALSAGIDKCIELLKNKHNNGK